MICIILFKNLNLLAQHMLIIICQWLQYQYLHHHLSLAMKGQPTLENCVPPLQHSDHLSMQILILGSCPDFSTSNWGNRDFPSVNAGIFNEAPLKTSSSSFKNALSAIRSRHLAVSCLRIHCFLLIPDLTLAYPSIVTRSILYQLEFFLLKILLYCISCSGNKLVTEL